MGPKSRNRSFAFHGFLCLILVLFLGSALAQNCSKDNPCATGCCSKDGWCGTGEDHCGAGNCVDTCDFKLECDADNPCETGCCSNAGYCGLGPDYCGKDVCVSGCDSKAECDPGFGSEWATSSKCPLNVCCSEYGFCGTTEEFCGNKTVKHPSCDKNKATLDRVVGYYEAWASRRPCNTFWPEQIPLGVYTHINFAFATIDPDTFEIRPDQTGDLALLKRVTDLKTLDPDLKVMIALGGWTFNDPGPTQMTFSDIARSTDNQSKFFKSLTSFLSTYNLDGVDLDWEYPAADDRAGREEDYENFPSFIANLKSALSHTFGRDELSITLPSSYWYLQHFDIAKLVDHVSFFNVMSYDLHGKWDLGNKWTGAYLDAHTNVTEIDKSLELLWRNNIDSSKVVLGLAFYARAYTLADPNCVKPGCEFASGANQGNCSQEVGILLNSEIDQIVDEKNLMSTFYDDADVQVLHWDDQWLSYDDEKTLQLKVEYARGLCLGGVMVWAVSHDTKDGKYSMALGSVSNRTSTKVSNLFQRKSTASSGDDDDDLYVTKEEDHLQCTWTKCGEFCPAGWQMMTRDDKWKHKDGEVMLDDTACTSPHARRLCCPPSETAPSCGWYSFKGGSCDGECPSGYSEVGSNARGCRSGYQAACCTTEDSDNNLLNSTRLYETCSWSDSPYCYEGKCTFAGSPWPTDFVESTTGSGAVYCNWDPSTKYWDKNAQLWLADNSYRKYCCDTSNDDMTWGTCTWRDDIENFGTKGKRCMSNCNSNEMKVAMEGGDDCAGKGGGAKTYCCTGVYKTSEKVINPELSSYDSSLAAWVDNPTCDPFPIDVIAKRTNIIGRKDTAFTITYHVLAQIILNSASAIISNTVSGFKKMWDNRAPKHTGWENLTSDKIPDWIHSDSNPTAMEYSSEDWAGWILCNPDGFNALISTTTGSHPICDHGSLTSDDYEAADGSGDALDEDTLLKRWTQERRALFELEKRAAAAPKEFHCNDGKRKRMIRYQSQPFPSVGDWANDAPQVQRARDLRDWDHCHTAQVGTFNLDNGRTGYETEHIFEMESVGMFLKWATEPANTEPKCADIDCLFLADFFNKKVLENPTELDGLDASHQAIPLQRVMEALGSEYKTQNFAVLWETINLNKAQLWAHGSPRAVDTWDEYVKNDHDKALGIIRDTVAVYNYMRDSDIWTKFKAINADVRTEMQTAQDQYKKTNSKDVSLLDCYDAWMDSQMNDFVKKGKDWVDKAVKRIQDDWKPKDDDSDLVKGNYNAVQVILDFLAREADAAIQMSNFDLGLGDDSMDTSDD